jgi:low density lipoprotein-related protein 2
MDRRLYYLDPLYEKVVRVDLPNGDNPKTLLDNEVKLRTLNIYRKRPVRSNHPCLSNQGGCDHICIPAPDNQRTCGCSVGYKKRDKDDTTCQPYSSFAIVSQLKLARGFSLKDQGEAMMPISGKGRRPSYISFYSLRPKLSSSHV